MPKPSSDARQSSNAQTIEALQQEKQALLRKLTEQARLADFDKLARAVSHEFNNFLNVLLLQIAVLEQELPTELRDDISDIRRQAGKVAAAVKQLQQYRQQCQGVLRPLDLNAAISTAVESLPSPQGHDTESGASRLRLALDAGLPQVLASEQELKQLCLGLAQFAQNLASKGNAAVTIRTFAGEQYAAIEVSGGEATRSDLTTTINECQPLVEELQGKLHSTSAGKLLVELVAMPSAAASQRD